LESKTALDKINKIYQFHQLLRNRKSPVSKAIIMQQLECSRATADRIIREMRDYLKAPIDFDFEFKGYKYSDENYELPGLWFSSDEILALLTMQKLLTEVGSGILDQQIAPLRKRIEGILASAHVKTDDMHRIRILTMAIRKPEAKHFQVVATALLRRNVLKIVYHSRGADNQTVRKISPQRLIHYRDNWYLDAWCHERNALRSFAVDRIKEVNNSDQSAINIPDEELDNHFAEGYGIFSGRAIHTAVLRFTPERARWIAEEQWHPKQQGNFLEDGRYELHIPYADSRELVMDILRHVPDVEVVSPQLLINEVKLKLRAGLNSISATLCD
jgi:predicted DNA-binding transcriptional regulator YafY